MPKDKGAPAYLSALVVKALVKHGWPARATLYSHADGFAIDHYDLGQDAPADFWQAVSIAVRIAARTHHLDLSEVSGSVLFNRSYVVTTGGFFKET